MMATAMSPAQEETVKAIQKHLTQLGGENIRWYIGITNNVRKKLFEEERVSEQNGKWLYTTVANINDAKEIKNNLLTSGINDDHSDDDGGSIIFMYQKNLS